MRVVQAAGGASLNASPDSTGHDAAGRQRARARRVGALAAVAVLVYALDLVSKTIVVSALEGGEPVRVIGDLVRLRVIRNSGAAFSIGTGMTVVFTVIAIAVVIAILRTARRLGSLPWAITLGLLLGGACGNLTDRLFRPPAPLRGHVVDWIEVFPATHFPIFNLGDSAIVCGGILAVFLAWRGHQIDGTRMVEAGVGTADPLPGEQGESGEDGQGESGKSQARRDGERHG